MATSIFLPERLRYLIEQAGVSRHSLAKEIDIAESTLNFILNRPGYAIGLKTLIALSDYFAVPLDYFFDRCSAEEAECLLKDYSKYFQQLRRFSYEHYIDVGSGKPSISFGNTGEYEAPYPYNLAKDIFQEPIDFLITDEALKEFEKAVNELLISERTKEMLFLYYKKGMTLGEIGKKYSLSIERVRQIIKKGARIISIDALKNILNQNNKTEALKNKIKSLNEEIDRLEHLKDYYSKEVEHLKDEYPKTGSAHFLRPIREEDLELIKDELDEKASAYLLRPIEDLELSVRAYNCLSRSGCHIINDVLYKMRSVGLTSIRNLGKGTASEIIEKLSERAKIDFLAP